MALKVTVKLDIKPRKGQSQEDAETEFLTLFSQYLSFPQNPFMTDYGKDAWGGYDGPFVRSVEVTKNA